MRYLCALLVALSMVLSAIVYDLESRPPEVVYVEPADELPWAIFIDHCDDLFALVWTTEPPTWFTLDDDFDAGQLFRMNEMYNTEQFQIVNICVDHSI